MGKWLAALTLAAGLGSSGCTVNESFIKAVDGYAASILPEYQDYVERDTRLDPDSKRIRRQTAQKFRELIDEAKKE
jgi:hypothetical protein